MILGIAVLLGFISVGWHIYLHEHRTRVAYVSVPEVFNGFDMKVEVEKKYQNVSEQRKLILDSLKFDFNQRLDSESPDVLEPLRREILYKERQYEESNAALIEQSNQEILTQLNVYMKEFGEKNDYDLILGAQGNGSLIYATEPHNVTKEMLDFVNARYQGAE